jgi:hypothetical protein
VPAVAPIYEVKELYVYYGRDLDDPTFAVLFNSQFGNNIVYGGTVEDYLTGSYENLSQEQYAFLYNLESKLNKYNSVDEEGIPVYKRFIEKFINYEGDLEGEYEFTSVDAVSAFLFYQLFLAFILGVYFTYQNPIVIKRNDQGASEVEGKVLPKVPRFGLGKREKKNKRG